MDIIVDDLLLRKPPPLPNDKIIIGAKVALYEKVSESTVLGVVVPQYRVLLGRKQTDTLFQFPGGKCDPEQTFEQTAVREMKEEANITLTEDKLHYLKSFTTKKTGETRSRLYVFFAAPYKGYFKPGDDIVELRWFSLEELDSALLPAHRPMGKELKNYLYNDGTQYVSLDDIFDGI